MRLFAKRKNLVLYNFKLPRGYVFYTGSGDVWICKGTDQNNVGEGMMREDDNGDLYINGYYATKRPFLKRCMKELNMKLPIGAAEGHSWVRLEAK